MKVSTKTIPSNAVYDIYRATGELEFAKVFLDRNRNSFNDNEFRRISSSIESYSNSLGVKLDRLKYIIDFANQKAIYGLTYYLIAFSTILIRSELLNILRNITGLELPESTVLGIDRFLLAIFLILLFFATKTLLDSRRLDH